MENAPPPTNEVEELRTLIQSFIHEERLSPKLEEIDKRIAGSNDPEEQTALENKRMRLVEDYQFQSWIDSAAKRVAQIRLVSHAIKYLHPDAKGSSLFADSATMAVADGYIGSEAVDLGSVPDVEGNAAALDVNKFLKLEYKGKTILQRVMVRDPLLKKALNDDPETADIWIESFAGISAREDTQSSHTLARQVYFPLPDGDYHLLAPLYPTSLAHVLHQRLIIDRFSDSAKEAHSARNKEQPFAHGYVDYPNLALQAFGGSKPQNISQLNSERHGESHLLASIPPTWRSAPIRPPMKISSIFGAWFDRRAVVKELTRALARFLAASDYTNINIRQARARMVDQLCDEALQVAAELGELAPGWSADSACRLARAEKLWLDPQRRHTEEDFASEYDDGQWREEIGHRFGAWLNAQLRSHKPMPMGDAEHSEWADVLSDALDNMEKELDHE